MICVIAEGFLSSDFILFQLKEKKKEEEEEAEEEDGDEEERGGKECPSILTTMATWVKMAHDFSNRRQQEKK